MLYLWLLTKSCFLKKEIYIALLTESAILKTKRQDQLDLVQKFRYIYTHVHVCRCINTREGYFEILARVNYL